jgi:hypothetical protein
MPKKNATTYICEETKVEEAGSLTVHVIPIKMVIKSFAEISARILFCF